MTDSNSTDSSRGFFEVDVSILECFFYYYNSDIGNSMFFPITSPFEIGSESISAYPEKVGFFTLTKLNSDDRCSTPNISGPSQSSIDSKKRSLYEERSSDTLKSKDKKIKVSARNSRNVVSKRLVGEPQKEYNPPQLNFSPERVRSGRKPKETVKELKIEGKQYFKCMKCRYKGRRKSCISRHVTCKHPVPPLSYKCVTCYKSCSSRKNLMMHYVNVHHVKEAVAKASANLAKSR